MLPMGPSIFHDNFPSFTSNYAKRGHKKEKLKMEFDRLLVTRFIFGNSFPGIEM